MVERTAGITNEPGQRDKNLSHLAQKKQRQNVLDVLAEDERKSIAKQNLKVH